MDVKETIITRHGLTMMWKYNNPEQTIREIHPLLSRPEIPQDENYDAAVGITGDVTDEADNCDATLDATFSDAVADGTCEGEQIITRTWSLTDDCGNTTTQEQTITVEDNTAPTFTVPGDIPSTKTRIVTTCSVALLEM